MLVLPDADIGMAADAAVSAAYGSAGERCMAISVLVAVGDAGDKLISAIQERIPSLKIGPGDVPGNEMGPLITREHRDKVAGYIASAEQQGAKVVVDGREAQFDGDGFFLGVSLLDDVKPGMDAYDDEIFGPVLCVVRAGSYAEGLKLINDNEFGNGTAIFTRDGGAARQFQFDVRGRHGGRQRADSGAGGVLQLRRLEGQLVWRHPHVRPGGRQVLHPQQGHHLALARSGGQQGGPGLSADAVIDRPKRCAERELPDFGGSRFNLSLGASPSRPTR